MGYGDCAGCPAGAGFSDFIILLATAAIILMIFAPVPPMAMHINMFSSVDKFALMAVPFFIFAGEIMGHGGISKRIVAWVLSIIGGVRGSLALTTVGTCTVFGAISGSSHGRGGWSSFVRSATQCGL